MAPSQPALAIGRRVDAVSISRVEQVGQSRALYLAMKKRMAVTG
jgi:hypothetical protein